MDKSNNNINEKMKKQKLPPDAAHRREEIRSCNM
jgi:hypothetical protein